MGNFFLKVKMCDRSDTEVLEINAKKIILTVIKWISTIGVALVVIFALLIVGVKLLGWDVYVVLSGSMEPHIPTGSVIYTKDPDIEGLQKGDIITFKLAGGKVATHRIDSVEGSGQTLSFITKGDANDAVDANPVLPGNIIGEYVAVIPYAGYIINYVQSPSGIFVSIAVIALLLILMLVPDIFMEDNKSKAKENAKEPLEETPVFEADTPHDGAEATATGGEEEKQE